MDSDQYEELCRYFIAEKANLPIEAVKSVTIPNPQRPGLPVYKHQIDLYWETGDNIALYLNIANAKWRGSEKVEQGEVMLLQQVCQKVSAHKAFMITNVGFTAGAVAAAKDEGEGQEKAQTKIFSAVPYYSWAHRGTKAMAVWMPRN